MKKFAASLYINLLALFVIRRALSHEEDDVFKTNSNSTNPSIYSNHKEDWTHALAELSEESNIDCSKCANINYKLSLVLIIIFVLIGFCEYKILIPIGMYLKSCSGGCSSIALPKAAESPFQWNISTAV